MTSFCNDCPRRGILRAQSYSTTLRIATSVLIAALSDPTEHSIRAAVRQLGGADDTVLTKILEAAAEGLPAHFLRAPDQAPRPFTNAAPAITFPTDALVQTSAFVLDLLLKMKDAGVSRRGWPNGITDARRDYAGVIFYADGRRFEMPENVAAKLGDRHGRYISAAIAQAEAGTPPRIQKRSFERYRLYWLYFAIRDPARAALFGRRPANDNVPPTTEG